MSSFKEPRSAPQSPETEFKIFKNSGHKRSLSHNFENNFDSSSFIIESERDINQHPYTPPSNRNLKKREEKMVAKSKYTTGFLFFFFFIF
jgi:hypothetical protein